MATEAQALPGIEPSVQSLPAGPPVPALVTLAWAFAPMWLMDRCAKRYGEMFTLTFVPSGRRLVMVSSPEAVKTVFAAPPEVAPSTTGDSAVAPLMGPNSVVTLTGPEHMRQRRLLLPPFHGERMREYEDTIVEATRRDMASWPLGVPMALDERMRAITLEVILRAVFGVEAQRKLELSSAIGGLAESMRTSQRLLLRLRHRRLTRPRGAIGRALDHLDAVIYDELARRRQLEDLRERGDILSLLLLARDEDGRGMTDSELRDEVVTLLLAGQKPAAMTVAWAVDCLVRHPDKLERLLAEIDAGAGEAYMQAVVAETLRLRPAVLIVARELAEPLRVGAHELPTGTRVAPSIYLVNRNPLVYEAPAEFRPERFLENPPQTFSWIPFGGGVRRCIGASFTTMQMQLILLTVLRELQPSRPARGLRRRGDRYRRHAITHVPVDSARVVWNKRSG
jgi:cytochrome P450 family 135